MSLEFDQIAVQLAEHAPGIGRRYRERGDALLRCLDRFSNINLLQVQDKIENANGRLKLRVAGIRDEVAERTDVAKAPENYVVVAADGSMIDVDRHAPVSSYVMNIGWDRIRYGEAPGCELGSRASLYTAERDLMFVDNEDGVSIRRVDAQLLGVEQGILELEAIATLIEESPADLPVVALVDGPLVVWGLADPRIKGLVRYRENGALSMYDRYLAAMDNVERVSRDRLAVVVGYISRPGVDYVANLVRVSRCSFAVADCSKNCHTTDPTKGRGCDDVGALDRQLFERYLDVGQRSALFRARSDGDTSEGTDISFTYLKTEEEIARLEMPEWVAGDPARLELALSLVADQAGRGQGYPAALIEAHERAVISGADRQFFNLVMEEALASQGLTATGSAKSRSKRVRGV